MDHRSRGLTDRLLVRAWIEPAHEQPLRVVILHRNEQADEDEERWFADAESASAFVRAWLLGLQRRWDSGERPYGRREE